MHYMWHGYWCQTDNTRSISERADLLVFSIITNNKVYTESSEKNELYSEQWVAEQKPLFMS